MVSSDLGNSVCTVTSKLTLPTTKIADAGSLYSVDEHAAFVAETMPRSKKDAIKASKENIQTFVALA